MDQNDMSLSERYPLLFSVNSPEDLKQLPQEKMTELAKEIREFLVERVEENGVGNIRSFYLKENSPCAIL